MQDDPSNRIESVNFDPWDQQVIQDHVSSLGYVILSLLARRDRTGYELSRFTTAPRSHILWSARHSQIYKELARLAAGHYVTFVTVEQTERPDKKVYRITPAGKDVLGRWVLTPPRPMPQKSELIVKAHASWMVEPEKAAALFREQAVRAEQEILAIEEHRRYLEEQTGTPLPPRADDPLFGTYTSIKFAIDSRRQLIGWCRWCEEQLLAVMDRRDPS